MKADYKNWVPKGMIYGLGAATAGLAGAAVVVLCDYGQSRSSPKEMTC